MSATSNGQDWEPSRVVARYADNTEGIHHVIAWIYGVIGVGLTLILASAFSKSGLGLAAAIGAFFGAMTLLHAALSAGARRRNKVARVGSVVVGVLMLAGFPVGTIVGGMLIFNGLQDWPPRRLASTAPAGRDLRDA